MTLCYATLCYATRRYVASCCVALRYTILHVAITSLCNQHIVIPQVRAQLQRLPGSPAQASRLAALHAEAAELRTKAAKMEARAVPRPAPPKYTQIMQSVQQFLAGSGSMQRIQSLLVHLEVSSILTCCRSWVMGRHQVSVFFCSAVYQTACCLSFCS